MDLSIVIPAYNAEAYIAGSISAIGSYLDAQDLDYEIVVVDDGSTDQTSAAVAQLKNLRTRIITLAENRGKYGALVTGMGAATGQTKIFTDADLPFDLEALTYIHKLISVRHFHLVIGDRSLRESQYKLETSWLRRFATATFSAMVRMFVTGGLFDTQCGLKGFRGDVADALFPLLHARGFSGDVELLYIALKYNLEIKRIPVRLRNAAPSSVRVFSHGVNMLGNIAELKIRWTFGRYSSETLSLIAAQSYWKNE